MPKKIITTEKLAEMVQRGFNDVIDKMARKAEVDKRFDAVDKRFDMVGDRLERIEKLILADHKRRIERLEMEMRELRDLFAIK